MKKILGIPLLVGLLTGIFVLMVIFFGVIAAKENENYLIFSRSGGRYKILANGIEEARQNEALVKAFIMEYVTQRETMNISQSTKMVSLIDRQNYERLSRSMSTREVHKGIIEGNLKEYEILSASGQKKNSVVLSYSVLTKDKKTIELEILSKYSQSSELLDNLARLTQMTRRYLVNLKYRFDDSRISLQERTFNPLGIVIYYYDIGEYR